MRTDHFLFGFISGLIGPLIGFYFYYLLFFRYMGFNSFYRHVVSSDKLISVLSLGVILNLALFFIFYQHYDRIFGIVLQRGTQGIFGKF